MSQNLTPQNLIPQNLTPQNLTPQGSVSPSGIVRHGDARPAVAPRLTARLARAVGALGALLALVLVAGAAPAAAATAPPLARGSTGAEVQVVQRQLATLGLFTVRADGTFGPRTQEAVDRFQEKFGLRRTRVVDAPTRTRLQELTRRGTGVDARCLRGLVICVDKTHKIMRLVRDGRIVQVADARFGGRGMETREGRFAVTRKSRNHVSSLYGSRMPYALFFSGGQAVHYSPDFASVGYRGASHGCVNLRDRDAAARLFDAVRVGTPVVVYRS